MKKVSVIVTTFNAEKTIIPTLKSILDQEGIGELFEVELIVVDDCSTDHTLKVLQGIPARVMTTPENTGGPNIGRNMGIKAATGDYLAITDHDDIWMPHRLKTMLPYLENYPIVTSGYTIIDVVNQKEFSRNCNSQYGFVKYEQNETFLARLKKLNSGQITYLGAIIYRRELKDILFEDYFGMVDFDWILRLFHQQSSLEICKPLYKRYVHGSNLYMRDVYRKFDFYYSLMSIEDYQELYPREVRTATRRINGSRARYYYLVGNMRKARYHFRKGEFNWITLLYYLTTYVGHRYVKKKFNIFG